MTTPKNLAKPITAATITIITLATLTLWGCPNYQVYRKRLEGEAILAESESSRKVAIEEASAKKEAATLLAEAEIERAKGIAQANKIIGQSLAQNEAYLKYLWIQNIGEGHKEIIYIPTEANLPILESTRLSPKPK